MGNLRLEMQVDSRDISCTRGIVHFVSRVQLDSAEDLADMWFAPSIVYRREQRDVNMGSSVGH